jgi:hypothetical protein
MVIFKSNLTYFITLGLESSEILNDQELESLYGMLAFDSANLLYRATRDGENNFVYI